MENKIIIETNIGRMAIQFQNTDVIVKNSLMDMRTIGTKMKSLNFLGM